MYYSCKVKVTIEDDNGKPKKHTELFLVQAVSVGDVEVQITEEFKEATYDWEIVSVSETKVLKILEPTDPADRA